MDIINIKQSLLDLKMICKNTTKCSTCPFDYFCNVENVSTPCMWTLEDIDKNKPIGFIS